MALPTRLRAAVRLLVLTATAVAPACAESLLLAAGVNQFVDREARELTDDFGYTAILGFSAPAAGLSGGVPWLDLDASRTVSDDNRVDRLGVLYIERVQLMPWLYLGGGIGSYYIDVRLREDGDVRRENDWRLGLKAVGGIPIGRSLFIEAAFKYSEGTADVQTHAWDLVVGFKF